MRQRIPLISVALTSLTAGTLLLTSRPAAAETTYRIQSIARPGDRAGEISIPADYEFVLGPLNDKGQLVFSAGTAAGTEPELLVQYAGGQFTLIAAAGLEGPVGTWPKDVVFASPASMNQQGNLVFAAAGNRGSRGVGTFRWDYQTQQITPVAVRGMPAVADRTFTGNVGVSPTINNHGEIALVATVAGPSGPSGPAVIFVRQDGQRLPVLLPGQELPDGGKVQSDAFPLPSLNDAGMVAFLARRQGQTQNSAYVWAQGTLTPLVLVGAAAPGGGKITSVSQVVLNNRDRTALVAAGIDGSSRHGVYRVADGQLIPVAVPGQELPGGGRFQTVQTLSPGPQGQLLGNGVSSANEAGQHALLATLEDGATAAYLVEPDGKLNLILKNGTTTDLGTVTEVGGFGTGINSRGQVALTVQMDGGPDTIVLLTPAAP